MLASPGVGDRAVQLLRSRSTGAVAGLVALSGVAASRLPLLDVPGYELASALTLLAVLEGAVLGIAAARLERPRTRALVPFAAASLVTCASLLPGFLASALAASMGRCSPLAGAPFCLVLPLPSALLASAMGVAAGSVARRRWTAALLVVAAALGSLAISLWPLWDGPQVFALNHLFGYFPGPLYDEALPLDSRLLTYRALTLLWVVVPLAGTAALDRGGLLPRPALVVVAGLLLGGWIFDARLGLRTRDRDLAKALPGVLETRHFVLHYPAAKSAEEVSRLERDAELRWAQVTRFLGVAPEGKVQAWLYSSSESKRRLVGAADTSYAKPWRRELHMVDSAFPHPMLRHELAHLVAGAAAPGPFKVCARFGLIPRMGIVEGVAVAADLSTDDLTLHQWAAAMRRLSLAPDVRQLLGTAGFWSQAPARAYTLAGSFLRWLAERHPEGLRPLYASGDFQAAFGEPLDALARGWEAFLDAMPLDERALHVAQLRFERGSLFERPCAREVASLRAEASRLRPTDPDRALELLARCEAIDPSATSVLKEQADLLRSKGDKARARELLDRILSAGGQGPAAKGAAQLAAGDAAWEAGDAEAAKDAFGKVLALHRDRATDRAAAVRLEALSDEEASGLLRRYFALGAQTPELVGLQELLDRRGGAWPTGAYLLGRQLLAQGDSEGARRRLTAALAGPLATRELRLEARRLLTQADYLSGDCEAALEALPELEREGDEVDRAFASDLRERCELETQLFHGPLKPQR